MSAPTKAEVRDAVERAIASRDELRSDPKALAAYLNEDRVMKWNLAQTEQLVVQVLEDLEREAAPKIEKPPPVKFDFHNAVGASIAKGAHDWEEVVVEVIHHAQGGLGSTGVFLLKLKGKGVVVLKQKTPEFVRDYFASVLLNELGIPAPRIRKLAYSEFSKLELICRPAPMTEAGTGLQIHSPRMKEAGAMLMEYVPGQELGSPLLKLERKQYVELLRQVGRMIAGDALLNNTDRTPFMRRGDGNEMNILVESSKNKVQAYAIDQAVNELTSEKTLAEYVGTLDNLDGEIEKVRLYVERTNSCSEAVDAELCAAAIKKGFSSIMDLADLEERCNRAVASTAKTFKSSGFESRNHIERMMKRVIQKYRSLGV